MRLKTVTLISVSVSGLWLMAASILNAQEDEHRGEQRSYQVVNLGNLGGTSSSGNTINNIGWAMGSANEAGDTTEQAAVWIYGFKFGLGTLGGPNSAVQWPVKNDRGLISGWSETAELDPLKESWSCTAFTPTRIPTYHVCRAFAWQWGKMKALPTLGGNNGFGAGANNRGLIAGWAETPVHDRTCSGSQVLQFAPVVWEAAEGEIRRLPTYPGDPDGAATAINDRNEVVGISGTCYVGVGAYSAEHALLWRDGHVVDLGNLGGKAWHTPMAINNRGDIVGFSDLKGDVSGGKLSANFHAFLWTKETGQMTDLGVLEGDSLSEALDINDRGQIVGVSYPSAHAFLYENGKMTDLNAYLPADSPLLLLAANGINDRGEITGEACVIADGGCPFGTNTPAFLALPRHRDWDHDSWNALRNMVVPDDVRKQVMKRFLFGQDASENLAAH